jgi:LacI family transcriptional regulator
MQAVAREAGVSQSTVSHVINRTRAIAPETEAAVWRAIHRTGYVNDSIARSLRTGSTQTVGLAIAAISNPFFAEVVGAIERQVSAMGRTVLLVDTHDDPERELMAVQELVARRCDGILLAPSASPERTFDLLERRNVPTVLVDRFADTGTLAADSVGVHNVEPVAELVDHVAGRGHTRVAFIAGLPGLGTSRERLAGFELGVQRNGLDPDPDLVVVGGSDEQSSYEAASRLLGLADPPSAIVAGNNAMTIGAMRALADLGLRVPEDVGLVGFDDFPWATLFRPRLTVVAQPLTELGTRAATMLHKRIADPSLPAREVRLPATLIVRDSAGHRTPDTGLSEDPPPP